MKAAIFTRYGSSEELTVTECEKTLPKDDEVLIRVHAVSINDWDWQALNGIPFVNRLIFGLFKPKRRILGSDVAGRIEAVGKKVHRFKAGDKVYGDLSNYWGGFAEYVCARESSLTGMPDGMTFEQAAAIPQAGALAVQALIESGRIRNGQKILINGAGGGVGTLGIQIARQYTVEVTGIDHTAKIDIMRNMGYDRVIDYTQTDFTGEHERYDLIIDTKTNRPVLRYLRVLAPNGTYVTMGGNLGRVLQILLLSPIISRTSGKRVVAVMLKPNRGLTYLNELFVKGALRPVIDKTFTLDRIAEAMRYFGEAKHKGKVVVAIAEKE